MHNRITFILTLFFGIVFSGSAQEKSVPIELQVLKGAVGVWDASIKVWPKGPGSTPIEFKGVETNRSYGEYWIASDFDSEFMGQTTKVHSIVGYDLDEKMMVGKVIDQGPYAAKMTGDYIKESKTVHWTTKVKGPGGTPILQKTTVTQVSADERLLVLSVPKKDEEGFVKFMQIKFVRRK